MFKETDKNPQLDIFSSVTESLTGDSLKRYTNSGAWHNQFRTQVLERIDEKPYQVLYSDGMVTPNASVIPYVSESSCRDVVPALFLDDLSLIGVNNDFINCGVTVHFVDKGIDTGKIIYQAHTKPTEKDNFTTYFYLQISKGVIILNKAIRDYFNNEIVLIKGPNESKLYSHPTLSQYIKYGVK